MRKWHAVWCAALGAVTLSVPLLSAPGAAAGPSANPQAVRSGVRPGEAAANNDPGFLQVYNANVENFPTPGEKCPGDWQDLLYFMRTQRYRPDLYTVQQVGGRRQLDVLLKRMKQHFGEAYAGVVAQPVPAAGGGLCGPEKARQTNAVVWRASRFALKLSAAPHNIWQVRRELAGKCGNNSQSRTVSLKAVLRDKVAGKNVTVASLHWPSRRSGASGQCASVNAAELSRELNADGYGRAHLFIAGGDTNWATHRRNSPGRYTKWYRETNVDLGGRHRFRDPVYADCAAAGGSMARCLAGKWTFTDGKRARRIDVLLARTPQGAPPPKAGDSVVPGFDEADAAARRLSGSDSGNLDYSDHRAVGARIHY